eukprot:5818619-Alexandrium_andersonii.AAC.1
MGLLTSGAGRAAACLASPCTASNSRRTFACCICRGMVLARTPLHSAFLPLLSCSGGRARAQCYIS